MSGGNLNQRKTVPTTVDPQQRDFEEYSSSTEEIAEIGIAGDRKIGIELAIRPISGGKSTTRTLLTMDVGSLITPASQG